MNAQTTVPVATLARDLPTTRALLLRWIAANEAKRKAQQQAERLRGASR
jgi:hypothetical protein